MVSGIVGSQALLDGSERHPGGKPTEKLGVVDMLGEQISIVEPEFLLCLDPFQAHITPLVIVALNPDERGEDRLRLAQLVYEQIGNLEYRSDAADSNSVAQSTITACRSTGVCLAG